MNNVKRGFKQAGIDIDAATATLILKRYDGNNDGELTYSDLLDMFKPKNIALQKEVERRTIFKDPG
jgi:Ca2+-binding EF-hand superfamily protein